MTGADYPDPPSWHGPARFPIISPMEILIAADRIHQRVVELADQIEREYKGRPIMVVGVLTGCLVFLADLIRRLDLPLRIHLVQASSYRGTATSPGALQLRADALPDLTGREILIVDDILDTGQTLSRVIDAIRARGAATVRVAVLLRKKERLVEPVAADYVGFDIPDEFVVGYGLDYNDEYRHLPHIAVFRSTKDDSN